MKTTTSWRRTVARAAFGAAVLSIAGIAFAQPDCGSDKPSARAACEQEKRVAKECAGRNGEALAACRQSVIDPRPEKRDCARFPEGYGRNKCEDANLRDEIEARCGTKSGDDLRRCYGEVTAKAPGR
jgi:hypothetical protein